MNEFMLPLIFGVAVAYAAVGHGGASGYLAVLALCGFAPAQMASSALVLNLLVSGTAFLAFWRSGFFKPKLFWPFAFASIPAAFVGGLIRIPAPLYGSLLFVSLIFAAVRLLLSKRSVAGGIEDTIPPYYVTVPIGLVIGLLSGIVGVGGGIFLSPLFILMGWADAKRTAAVSAAFIWVNSAAGLFGHLHRQGLHLAELWPLTLAAFLGGLLGSHLGSQRLQHMTLRRILAGVLGVAAYKSLILVIR
jgi:uncharacterized membrane protein YfcA